MNSKIFSSSYLTFVFIKTSCYHVSYDFMNLQVVRELRKLCEQVDTLKVEREVIDNELKTAKCDMTNIFMKVNKHVRLFI